MNFSFTMNSSVSATLEVYSARALEACDLFPKSGGGGGYITSWKICCPLLFFSHAGGCMMLLEPPLKEKPPSYALGLSKNPLRGCGYGYISSFPYYVL